MTFVLLTVAAWAPAAAQQVLPRDLELELAESALPAHLREESTVYVLEPHRGLVVARQGTNGFHALVSRIEPAVFRGDWAYEEHPDDVLLPIAFDAAGAAGPLPMYLDAHRLQAQGTSAVRLKELMRGRIDAGVYRAPERAGVAYMLAPILRAYPDPYRSDRRVTRSIPHRMFYAPHIENEDVAGDPRTSEPFVIHPGPHGYLVMRAHPAERDEIRRAHTELLERLCGLNPLYCLDDPDAADLEALRAVALEMPRSVDYGDLKALLSLFTENAVMVFPFRPDRAVGRAAIEAVMRPLFERNAARGEGPYFGFEPREVHAQLLGADAGWVSWVMGDGDRPARRTAVLRKIDGTWKIQGVHADNWAR